MVLCSQLFKSSGWTTNAGFFFGTGEAGAGGISIGRFWFNTGLEDGAGLVCWGGDLESEVTFESFE
jgi:hypothetical protein